MSGNLMKSSSCLILAIALFSFGCAHNSTSSLSLASKAPSFQESQLKLTASPEQSPVVSEETTAEQSPSQSEKPGQEEETSSPGELKEGKELSEDLANEELDFEEELDLFDEEEEEVVTVADPLEPFNRAVFHFNDKLYFWFLKPAARGYNYVFPEDFRICVRNFFVNLLFPVRFVNSILQGNFRGAGIELSRFMVNSTLGLGGLFDPSSRGAEPPHAGRGSGTDFGCLQDGTRCLPHRAGVGSLHRPLLPGMGRRWFP